MSTQRILRKGVLGKKIGMTQIFTDEGFAVPVTVVQAGPCLVVEKRTMEKDGYVAVQLGFGDVRKRDGVPDVAKPIAGFYAKRNLPPQRKLKELRLTAKDAEAYEVGKPVDITAIFKKGEFVDVQGDSKGKGYQGVMKRHRMKGFRNTHGTHEFFRHGGSIGCRLTPGRVHKGKRMSGHMGDVPVTVQNLAVMDILPEENLILIRGALPGSGTEPLVIRNSKKRQGQKWRPLQEVQEIAAKNPMKAAKAGQQTKGKK